MRFGIVAVGFLTALWGAIGMCLLHAPVWEWVLPDLLVYQIARTFMFNVPPNPDRGPAERRRIGRLIGIWSAAEGVAILVGINIAVNLGDHHAVMPVIAIAVGLHFIPLARYMPAPPYYVTGTLLTAAGLVGLALPAALAGVCTAFAGFLILLFTMMIIALRAPRMVAG
jgi:hypothetical protein